MRSEVTASAPGAVRQQRMVRVTRSRNEDITESWERRPMARTPPSPRRNRRTMTTARVISSVYSRLTNEKRVLRVLTNERQEW